MYRFLILTALAHAVAGQSPSLETKTDVGVRVTSWELTQQPKTTSNFIPATTVINGTKSVLASFSSGFAQTKITAVQSGKTGTYVFHESAKLDGQSVFTQYDASTATKTIDRPHAWLIRVPANPNGNELLVDLTTKFSTKTASATVDIGDDLQVELTHTMSSGNLSRTFKLGTKATVVRIETYAAIQTLKWKDEYDFTIGATLNKDDPVKFTPYGKACGMQLVMTDVVTGSGHNVGIDVQGGFPASWVMLMIGAKPVDFPFPGTQCRILVQGLAEARIRTDTSGKATLNLPVPGRMSGLIYVQTLSFYGKFGVINWRFSNGIKADAGN